MPLQSTLCGGPRTDLVENSERGRKRADETSPLLTLRRSEIATLGHCPAKDRILDFACFEPGPVQSATRSGRVRLDPENMYRCYEEVKKFLSSEAAALDRAPVNRFPASMTLCFPAVIATLRMLLLSPDPKPGSVAPS